jgi:hypothetical protein
LVAGHCRVSESRDDQPDAHALPGVLGTRERGNRDPDLDVLGPNAFPLSRDALYLRTPRDACCPRKAE